MHTMATLDSARTLAARLEAISVSQNFFAKLVGYSSGEVSNYLSGKKTSAARARFNSTRWFEALKT